MPGGQAAAETRRVNGVAALSEVELAGRFETVIVPGERAEVTLEGESAALDRLGVRVKDDTIRLWEKCTVFCGNRDLDIRVRIVAPGLRSLEAAKGAEVRLENLTARDLSIEAAMGAAVTASGACETLTAEVAMGGALSAKDLACKRADVDAAMGGAASVRASDHATAEASMGGAITVYGNPPAIDSRASMGGSISRGD
jgi:hypothetical protein